MKKRILSVVLISAIALSVSGCNGGTEVPEATTEGSKTTTTTTTADTTKTEETAMETTEIEIIGTALTTELSEEKNITEPISSEEAKEMLTGYFYYGMELDMEKLKSVQELYLAGEIAKKTADSVLGELTNLTHLTLMMGSIEDVSFLNNLTKLTVLDLRANRISDISKIENMNKLTELYISENNISDISVLKNLNNLSVVSVFSNNISQSDAEQLQSAMPDCTIYSE